MLALGQRIAFLGRGEAALRREAKLLDRREFRGFFDPSKNSIRDSSSPVLVVMRPSTAFLPLGRKRSGSKPPSAVIVIFEEIAVDVEIIEKRIGNRLVAARGNEGRAEIAAAQMHGDDHVLRPA